MEIGALPIEDQAEPFHILLDYFPGSKIIAFEIDEALCADLNDRATKNIKFYPVALGSDDQECTFFETNHPMCCSLYRPNEELLRMYNNLDVAMLKSVGTVKTMRLDDFVAQHDIAEVDFIKIDIQGAELDVFQSGVRTLRDVVFIVSEVEFIPLYQDQPLFGDVCAFLSKQDFMFHKFLGLAGRTVKPIVMNNDPHFPSQHMWSDAVYIKNLVHLTELPSLKLLKMGILSFLYGSPDVAFFCFKTYDVKNNTNIAHDIFS
jgi:FkbM family methyltransferase